MSAVQSARALDPAPAGSVPQAEILKPIAPGRATYSTIAFWRGKTLRWRATCLACGASQSEDATRGAAADDPLPVQRFSTTFANTHDAVGCLPTFTTEREDIGAILEALVGEHLGEHAEDWLEAMSKIALDGGKAQWVVAGSGKGSASLDASFAHLAAMHRPNPHSALVAQDAALAAQCPDGTGVTALSVSCPELGHGARRWWVFTHTRTLAFQTARTDEPGKVGISAGEDSYSTSDEPDAEILHIEPYQLIVAVQLAAL